MLFLQHCSLNGKGSVTFFLGGGGEMLLVLFNLIVTNLKKNLEDGKMTLSNDTKAIS